MIRPSPNNTRFPSPTRGIYRGLPKSIWALGLVSLFMDSSSELIHSLLPIFMATALGASAASIGIIEGIAEAAAAITKVFSGTISDYFRKRKFLVLLGYGLAALTKPIFPLAASIEWVFAARLIDRIGKGIRGAPRDALIADIVPAQLRGAAYGLRQALDSVGAFVGPLLAVVFMLWLANDIKSVLWVAVVPAFVAVLLIIIAVHEPVETESTVGARNRLALVGAGRLPMRYWFIVALGAVFTLARFSEAFLLLRARDVGLSAGFAPVIMIIMNTAYAIFAYPAGAAADRIATRILLAFGLGVLVAADVASAVASSPRIVFLGAALWGLHMAFTQGLLSKLVADASPGDLRGTAFGIFNLVSGGALLLASVIAGSLWSAFGAPTAFIAGASFAALAAIGLLLYGAKTRNTA